MKRCTGRASGFSIVRSHGAAAFFDDASRTALAPRWRAIEWTLIYAHAQKEAISISTISQPVVADRSLKRTIKAYIALTKPRVLELLLVSTVPVMFLAEGGLPNLWLVVATVIGGAMSASSAASFNMYLDRDIDKHMKRTRNRPLVTGEISDRAALIFSWMLAVASTVWLLLTTNALTAALSVGAIFFYVVIYTMILKRRTEQNIIWGGIAGCFPVLIGWTAVTGSLAWPPFILFIVVFLWTPPHYWPLAMRFREDYGRARVPMLPVVASDVKVARQVVAYSWAMVAASVALWPVAGTGWTYGVVSLALGAAFLREAHGLLRRARAGLDGAALKPMRLFHGSISYLSLLFLAVALAPFLP